MFAMEFVILFFHILQITFYAYGHDWQQKSNPETNLTASENIFKLIFINSTVSDKEKLDHYGLEQLARLYSSCSVPICEGPLSRIYCGGMILASSWYFGVPKQCPGSKLRFSPEHVLNNFDNLLDDGVLTKDEFLQFCDENFENVPYFIPTRLTDWKSRPSTVDRINEPKMREFAKALHRIWPNLARRFHPDVEKNPQQYKVLPVPNRFIVPGGRFQVYFYWDSYWILKGLYFSQLFETAREILENFAYLIKKKGFIPNSGNIELSRRSQPPYFTQMIEDYYEHTNDKQFLEDYLPYAEQELNWWRNNRTLAVIVNNSAHVLYQFHSITDCPRPENLIEDSKLGFSFKDTEISRFFWSSITSACESGLDFSSRWFIPMNATRKRNFYTDRILTATNDVVPLDLNVLMARNYESLSKLYGTVLNQSIKSKKYGELSNILKNSIQEVFYHSQKGVWFDYDLYRRELRTKFYPSNIYPLMLYNNGENQKDDKRRCAKALDYLQKTGALNFKGGVPVSLERNSTEQWDFPNCWAPSIHLFIESLRTCKENFEAQNIARSLADKFLKTTYNGLFNPPPGKLRQMWEKYDVRYDDGTAGRGGEYLTQSGFGWTNGVVMELIRLFYTDDEQRIASSERFHEAQFDWNLLSLLPIIAADIFL